jgi:hypothetical protein
MFYTNDLSIHKFWYLKRVLELILHEYKWQFYLKRCSISAFIKEEQTSSRKITAHLLKRPLSKTGNSQALVAHICNPSYSGGRNEEDHSTKPAMTNSFQGPISKNPSQKRAGGVAQGVGLEFKPQYNTSKNAEKLESWCMTGWKVKQSSCYGVSLKKN